jgi:membrane peptidoglycan carboxypeptidase
VNTAASRYGGSGLASMSNEYGVALGQASLSVVEQATMLATIDDDGIYHDAHVIASITKNNAPPTPIKITTYPVFSANSTQNTDMASQVQYAMSEDTAAFGTAPTAAMSNGQEVIAKTGTTNTAQSAFFIGAIPSQSLAIALFTDNQGNKTTETLNNLGGNAQGGYGGTWPASIWHTYAENEFVPLGIEQFPTPTFTGGTWNLVPPGLRVVPHKKTPKKHGNPLPTYGGGNGGNGGGNGGNGGGNGGNGGNGQSVNATAVGGTVGGIFAGLPGLRARRRRRKRGQKHG